MQRFWTPAKVEILKEEWKTGTSVRAIASMLGGSRNTVIGKARRLELPMHAGSLFHPNAPRKRGERKRAGKKLKGIRRAARFKRVRALPSPQSVPPPPSPAVRPHALRISFSDLEPQHCRYSVSVESPHFFCGHVKQKGSAFCRFHHVLCHEPLRGKPRDNARRYRAHPFAGAM